MQRLNVITTDAARLFIREPNTNNNKQTAPTELINEWCYVGIKHALFQISGVLHGARSGANH